MSDDQVTRLRDARKWFNDGQCCGQVDSAGICAAPACIFGEALKEFSRATDRIEVQAAEIAALQKRVAELEDFCEDYLVRFELLHITNTQDAPEDATGFLAKKACAILGVALEGGKE